MSKNPKERSGATAAQGGTSRREMLRQQQEAEAARQRRMRLIGLLAAVVALAIIGTVVGIAIHNHDQKNAANASVQIVPPDHNADNSGIIVNPGKAKAGAPTVVVYQDYQCPTCKALEDATGTWMNDLAAKGDISLEYRTMAFLDAKLNDQGSKIASIAAACADTVGAYEKYHDTVYANQPQQEGVGYTDDELRTTFAQKAGITGDNLTKFQKCYDDKATMDFATGTDDKATAAGINGTPTYKVNGKEMDWQQMLKLTNEQGLLALIKQTAA